MKEYFRPWKLGSLAAGLAILAYWITVDWSYTFYNARMGHPVGVELRCANFFASSLLYLLCGLIWLPRMTFRELLEYRGKRARS